MAAKKKTSKKAVSKSATKKAVKKAAKKTTKKAAKKAVVKVPKMPAKKTAKKAVKKTAKKASKTPAKAVAKKAAPVEKAAEKKVPAPKKAGPVKVTAFASKQRQRLLDLRDELVDAMSGVAGEIKDSASGSDASGSGMHQGDAGSDAYDRDFALSMLAKEQDALYEIEQALRRIDRGVYGICEISGAKIPQPRLEALPFARLTVDCQAQWEKDYGNRRFRPASEIGFSNGNIPEDDDSLSVSLDGDN